MMPRIRKKKKLKKSKFSISINDFKPSVIFGSVIVLAIVIGLVLLITLIF